jgi:DNA replication protein DnaC
MKAPALDIELRNALKKLRLGALWDVLPERLVLAEKQSMPYQDLLLLLLQDEISRRESTSARRRAKAGNLDEEMIFERWDKTAKVKYDKRLLNELASLRFIHGDKNVVILGPVGVGKTFIANALGQVACRHGFDVAFWRADDMLRVLRQSRLDNSTDQIMRQLCTVDLLIVDDFGIESMTREESRDVYRLFIERSGRASTIITSNRDTSEWISVFDDVLQAQSAVDRFVNAAYDLVIEGETYRARQKPRVADEDEPPPEPQPKVKQHPRRKARPSGPR